jgi:large subunit ribosomal protein L29
MKVNDLRQLSREELQTRLSEAVESMSGLRFQQGTSQLDNPLKIRALRRNIARLRTLLRETEQDK